MSDRLLKESDVLKAIDKRIEKLSKDPQFIRKNGIIDVAGVKKYILAIPSADRPRGKWIWVEHSVFEICKCSICGYCSQLKIPQPYNFCPNCGADMREREDE